jgi:hypothetical protein
VSTKGKTLGETLVGSFRSQSDTNGHRVYLFVSYDLANATSFKDRHKQWPVVINKFYELAVREISNISANFKLWKFAGDEVIMYRTVADLETLAGDVANLHEALTKVIDQIVNTFGDTRNVLSVKGTLWLARATYIPPQRMQDALSEVLSGSPSAGEPDNIKIEVGGAEGGVVDFLGPDIDVGFRIAQYSDKRKLTISANLAQTLFLHSPQKSVEGLRIVGLQELKGVWNGRPYPIIWYYNDWSKIDETFYYDDDHKSPIKAYARVSGASRFSVQNRNTRVSCSSVSEEQG